MAKKKSTPKRKYPARQVWIANRVHDVVAEMHQRVCDWYAPVNKGVFFTDVMVHGIAATAEKWGHDTFAGINFQEIVDDAHERDSQETAESN